MRAPAAASPLMFETARPPAPIAATCTVSFARYFAAQPEKIIGKPNAPAEAAAEARNWRLDVFMPL